MRKLFIYLFIFVTILFFSACSYAEKRERETISVSILPLKYLVDEISGGDFTTMVIVPPGASPETYEPTVKQINALSSSLAYFQIGLIDFEHGLAEGVHHSARELQVVTLSDGLELLEGECGHSHGEEHHHHHGTDPHVWLSLVRLRNMAGRITETLEEILPDSTAKYRANLANLTSRIDSVDFAIRSSFSDMRRKTVLLFHPALAYFCDDYGLKQLAVEQEGKEPSVGHMKTVVSEIREQDIRVILYQEQLHKQTVEALVRETGIRAVPFDPVAYHVPENLLRISSEILTAQ